jgi:hypothetical protein
MPEENKYAYVNINFILDRGVPQACYAVGRWSQKSLKTGISWHVFWAEHFIEF